MESLTSRQAFCNHFSHVFIGHLCINFSKDIPLKRCLLQHMKSNAKRDKGDFVIPRSIVKHLAVLFHAEQKVNSEFEKIFENCLTIIKKESTSWDIPIQSWREVNGNYIIEVNKTSAFQVILQNILTSAPHNSKDKACVEKIFCHLNDKATVEDIRTLLLGSLARKNASSAFTFLSMDNETVTSEYEGILKDLNLEMKLLNNHDGFKTECKDTEDLTSFPSPVHFSEYFSLETTSDLPCLKNLRGSAVYKTAFASRILNQRKNKLCHSARCCFPASVYLEDNCNLHICSQRKMVLAQQTEMCHALRKDTSNAQKDSNKHEHNMMPKKCEKYLAHAGVHDFHVDATTFLRERKRQIRESFEAKHHVKASGEHWEDIINQMRTAIIKLEFFQTASSTNLRLAPTDELLPTDCTFVLYNFSRLSTLLQTFQERVERGEYPPLPSVRETDFSLLIEDLEWNLVLNHLWIFKDVIETPLIATDTSTLKISANNLVKFLQNLSRCVSAFYSRHHILVENLQHLTPLIFARIHLVKASLKVMEEVFRVLDIKPLHQM